MHYQNEVYFFSFNYIFHLYLMQLGIENFNLSEMFSFITNIFQKKQGLSSVVVSEGKVELVKLLF